jgi:hypothetical protein
MATGTDAPVRVLGREAKIQAFKEFFFIELIVIMLAKLEKIRYICKVLNKLIYES